MADYAVVGEPEPPQITVIARKPRPDGRIDLTFLRSDRPDSQEIIIGAPAVVETPDEIWNYLKAYERINTVRGGTHPTTPTGGL